MLEVSIRHSFAGFDLSADFSVPNGVTAVFGPSGSGKTTIVNGVAGLLRPDAGRIVLNGAPLFEAARARFVPPHKRRIGYVFQDARLFPHMSVAQNLRYGARFAKARNPQEFDRIVDLLGLEALLKRQPNALSGGEKQRVAIGRALLSDPQLLLMDEPLAALDDARKSEILHYLERVHAQAQLPILYVSHSMAEVARLATSLVLLKQGRVVASGALETVLADPQAVGAFGVREAGAVLSATLAAQEADGLTRLETGGGSVWLPQVAGQVGDALRLRILAQDVMLATERPQAISALNILSARIESLHDGAGPGVLVRLSLGREATQAQLLARITRRSAQALSLKAGQPVFAVLKAVSVARDNVGLRG